VITCPACGTENEDFFMFCLNCGAELAGDAAGGDEGLETTEYTAADLGVGEQLPESAPTVEAPPPPPPPPVAAKPPPPKAAPPKVAPPPPPAAPPATARATRGRLVLIREDGTDGPTYDLYTDRTIVGRDGGDLKFPQDEFLGTEHAVFEYSGDTLTLTPLDTTNGVFKRIVDQAELVTGDSFRIGQELLRFELVQDIDGEPLRDEEGTLALGSPLPPDSWGRLSQMVGTEDAGNVYLLSGQEIFMGRERGDIVFPDDGYVSGSHAVIARANNRYFLRDLGSSNGTYVRLKTSEDLYQNDLILAGQQLFRVEP